MTKTCSEVILLFVSPLGGSCIMGNWCPCLKPDQESEMLTLRRVHACTSEFETTKSPTNQDSPTLLVQEATSDYQTTLHQAPSNLTHETTTTTTHHQATTPCETNLGSVCGQDDTNNDKDEFDEDDGFFLIEFGTQDPDDARQKLRTISIM